MQAYVAAKQWKDGFGAGETRITAADLTHIESGISAATQGVTNLEARVTSIDSSTTQKIQQSSAAALDAARALLPVGVVLPYAGTQAPTGWALCNGQLLNKNTYNTLFQVLGTQYGMSGDSFRVPDLRDRFIAGAGSSYAVGATGGAAQVFLGVNQIPGHTHDIGGKASTAQSNGVGMYQSTVAGGTGWQVLSTTENGSLSGLIAKSTGGGQAHENRPPYLALTYIIKVS